MIAENTPTPGKTWDQWLADTLKLVGVAQNMLKEPLDQTSISDQATQAEDYQVQVSEALSQAEAWLDFHKAAELGKIDRTLTVLDRTVRLDVAVMSHRILRDKLEAIAVSLKSRMRRAQWNA